MPSAFVQDNEYVLDDDDESEKEDEDKGNAENDEEFQILIHSEFILIHSFTAPNFLVPNSMLI